MRRIDEPSRLLEKNPLPSNPPVIMNQRPSSLPSIFLIAAALLVFSCDRRTIPAESAPSTGEAEPPVVEMGQYDGSHDTVPGQERMVIGWAIDKNDLNAAVKVDIFDGETLLDTVLADSFREDLKEAGKGNGKHGIYYPLPLNLADGKPHSILIKLSGTNIPLYSSPHEITLSPKE
ncbi:MAG: hypothetical protein QOE70_5145 [Chthoniobacter sp.]|jgi:hypothetical protein|nr:hypothetical protein [Chthoniobacter sp.]